MTALSTVTETLKAILLNNRFVSHLRAYYIFRGFFLNNLEGFCLFVLFLLNLKDLKN